MEHIQCITGRGQCIASIPGYLAMLLDLSFFEQHVSSWWSFHLCRAKLGHGLLSGDYSKPPPESAGDFIPVRLVLRLLCR